MPFPPKRSVCFISLVYHSDTMMPVTACLVSYRLTTTGESPCQRWLSCWPRLRLRYLHRLRCVQPFVDHQPVNILDTFPHLAACSLWYKVDHAAPPCLGVSFALSVAQRAPNNLHHITIPRLLTPILFIAQDCLPTL